jgi:hypothetical protein
MTICNYSGEQKELPITLHERKTESGFGLENSRSGGFALFCSLKRTGASKSRICAVMQIDDEKFRRFAESAGIGRHYYISY